MAVIQIYCKCEVVSIQHHNIKPVILDSTFNELVQQRGLAAFAPRKRVAFYLQRGTTDPQAALRNLINMGLNLNPFLPQKDACSVPNVNRTQR